jgi:hypothetical protein
MPAPTMMTFNFNFDEAVVGFALAIVEEMKIVYVEDSVGEEKVGKIFQNPWRSFVGDAGSALLSRPLRLSG